MEMIEESRRLARAAYRDSPINCRVAIRQSGNSYSTTGATNHGLGK